MKHYSLQYIRSELERKRGEPYTDTEFRNTLAAFSAYINRRGLYSRSAVNVAIHRGWMSVQMAHFFKNYALE